MTLIKLFNFERASKLFYSPLGLLAVFDEVYADVTRAIVSKIFDGEFENRKELFNLVLEFDSYYRDAKDAYLNGRFDQVPAVWAKVFREIGAGQQPLQYIWRRSVLEALVLPIIVHMVHDLPLAITRCLQTAPVQWQTHLRDYDKINNLIDQGIRDVQHKILAGYSPTLMVLSAVTGQDDESLLAHIIRLLRGTTWYDAARLFSNSPQAAWLSGAGIDDLEEASNYYPVELDRVSSNFLVVLNSIEKRTDSYLNFILSPSLLMLPVYLLFWTLRLCDTLYLAVARLFIRRPVAVKPPTRHVEPGPSKIQPV